jgi:SAM-dependent methyltransferase
VGYAPARDEAIRYARLMLNRILEVLDLTQGRILDVGMGRGLFLAMCQERGFAIQGCEICPRYAGYARNYFGIPVQCTPFEELNDEPESFDIITFWDVFEHFPEPEIVLRQCQKLLKAGGFLALEVPNAGSIYAQLLRKRWWFGFEHVFYFTKVGLLALLRRYGFEPVFIETDNVNLVSLEGLARLRFFGEDGVWGRAASNCAPSKNGTKTHLNGDPRPWRDPAYQFSGFNFLMRSINQPLNSFFNSRCLGDQLRIFARKR